MLESVYEWWSGADDGSKHFDSTENYKLITMEEVEKLDFETTVRNVHSLNNCLDYRWMIFTTFTAPDPQCCATLIFSKNSNFLFKFLKLTKLIKATCLARHSHRSAGHWHRKHWWRRHFGEHHGKLKIHFRRFCALLPWMRRLWAKNVASRRD